MSGANLESLKTTIKQYILEEFLPGVDASELTDEAPLITGGILDSLATVKVVAELEERFGIQIAPHEASTQHFNSVADIARLVVSKL